MIAYNKIDIPDSGDYIEEVQEFLWGKGLATDDVHAISAVTGQGVLGLVRRTRVVLDQMPTEVRDLGLSLCVPSPVTWICAGCMLCALSSAVRGFQAEGDIPPDGLLGQSAGVALHGSRDYCSPDIIRDYAGPHADDRCPEHDRAAEAHLSGRDRRLCHHARSGAWPCVAC